MNNNKGLIVCISGPSGAGKGTVLGKVAERFPEMVSSISVTTRAPRGEEQDGVEYYFRTKEQFEAMIESGEILEYDTYVGNYYGTPRAHIENLCESGTDCLVDLTVKGSIALKDHFGDNALTIFLMPPSLEVLEERLRNRGTETEEKIRQRLAQARGEMKSKDRFDNIVINDKLEDAVNEVIELIENKKDNY
ncbi:MAG: guanylate kinase [Saccharofermentans sp.]|nr:guanylate kinase [Saccharofermentans sp.]